MKIKFSKEQAEKLIQAYYQIHERKEVQVSSKATRGCEGIFETPCTNVTFTISGIELLFGESVAVDERLTKKEVEGILTTMLSDEGYSAAYNYGVLATGCRKVGSQKLDEGEFIRYFLCDFEDVEELIDKKYILGANSQLIYEKARRLLKK